MGSHRTNRDTRANRGGRGGGARAEAIKLNREIIASRSAGEILAIVEDRGESFNEVNVATAVNKLCKVARARDDLRRDPRYIHLLELVQKTTNEMNPQGIANVLNALSKLGGAAAAVSREGWKRLAEAAERQAREMNPQGIANVLNALSKLGSAAAAAVSQEGWSYFAVAVERQSVAMNAQAVSNTLNAYAEMRKRRPQAVAAVAETGWHSLAAATTRTAPTMTNQDIALTVDVAKKAGCVCVGD